MVKIALLVGVSEYQKPFDPLPSVIKNINQFATVLQKENRGNFDEVVSLVNPNKIEFEEAIYVLFSDRQPDDLLLFYFSGYGVSDRDRNLYLTVPQTQIGKDKIINPATAVPAYFLQQQLTNSLSEREVVILDCCYRGAIAKGLTAKDERKIDIQRELGGKGRAILTSSSVLQSSFQRDPSEIFLYTQYLVKGIATGAADKDRDGQISAEELHDYAFQKMQKMSPAMIPRFYPVEQKYRLCIAKAPQNDPKRSNKSFSLLSLSFEVVTVNEKGEIINLEEKSHPYYQEDLGIAVMLDMMEIPGGTFLMGTEETEIERLCKKFDTNWFRWESPQHKVKIEPFFMGKTPITQAQWREVVTRVEKIERDLDRDPSTFKGDNRPVECVSWFDAVEFCARLSKLTGQSYRLPSEAEWEYACRAGTKTPFHFGETITTDLANYNGVYTFADEPKGKYRKGTTESDEFIYPNAFGLYDMHGNVWEWCADPWHDNYEGAPTDECVWAENDNDYQNLSRNLKKLLQENVSTSLRGGSWGYNPEYFRGSNRLHNLRNYQVNNIGFRVACSRVGGAIAFPENISK